MKIELELRKIVPEKEVIELPIYFIKTSSQYKYKILERFDESLTLTVIDVRRDEKVDNRLIIETQSFENSIVRNNKRYLESILERIQAQPFQKDIYTPVYEQINAEKYYNILNEVINGTYKFDEGVIDE